MKIKTSELEGDALDYMIAVCEKNKTGNNITLFMFKDGLFKPSSDRSQAGPIIEREGIDIISYIGWKEAILPSGSYKGTTVLQAAMRCYVASKMGDEVEVPDELIKGIRR